MKIYLALDVGGTEIKSFLFREDGELLYGPQFDRAHSDRPAEEIEENFCRVIQKAVDRADLLGNPVSGIGMAIPGPFDYENGISFMRGIGKYDSLYGLSVKNMLSARFPGIPLAFANDADLFGLGEYHFGGQSQRKRVFYLCIGTGIGSCFIEEGHLIKNRDDVPADGWIFRTSCKDATADAYLSVTGLLRMAARETALLPFRTGKALSEAAFQNVPEAVRVFEQFGGSFSETVIPFAERFHAERIVVGGQMALSFSLFGEALTRACERRGIDLGLCPDSTLYAGKGTIRLFTGESSI